MSYKTLANFEKEQTLFTEFIESGNDPNILLFQGGSGSGKSHLVEHCLRSVPDIPSLLIKMQSGQDSMPFLFTKMGSQRGWDKLPNFTRIVANLLEEPNRFDDPLWQAGMYDHLREIGKISDIESRLSRYQLITKAWFADSWQFDAPFLLAIDTYENVSPLFDHWFSSSFLTTVATNSQQVRVIVSGQTMPEIRTDLSFCSAHQELKGIHDVHAWQVWAEAVGYQISSPDALANVVQTLDGNPSQIIEVIKIKFPKRNVQAPEKGPTFFRRFRKKMMEVFNLHELVVICFDLGIDHENLPDHTIKERLIIELIAYCKRSELFEDLVQICQEERPQAEW